MMRLGGADTRMQARGIIHWRSIVGSDAERLFAPKGEFGGWILKIPDMTSFGAKTSNCHVTRLAQRYRQRAEILRKGKGI